MCICCDFERALNAFANIHFRADIKAILNIRCVFVWASEAQRGSNSVNININKQKKLT